MWEADGQDTLPDEMFRLGIEFADGRCATSLEPYWSCRPEGPVFRSTGSANGDGRFSRDERWWVGPTPHDGPITLFCEWPVAGIALTQMELPADAIRTATPSSA